MLTATVDAAWISSWQMKITDTFFDPPVLVRTLSGSNKPVGTYDINAVWDGKDENGNFVCEGTYTVEVTATAQAQETSCSDTDSFTVDVVNPYRKYPCDTIKKTWSSTDVTTGEMYQSLPLITTSGTGLQTSLSLGYNTGAKTGVPFGGWRHSYEMDVLELPGRDVLLTSASGSKTLYVKQGGGFVSPPGNYSTLANGSQGKRILTMKDGTVYTFSSNGMLSTVADRNGNKVTLGYTSGQLTTITNSYGKVTTLTYSGSNVTDVGDPNGNHFTFGYTGGRLSSVTYPDNSQWSFTYNTDGSLKTKTDPKGNIINYSYDSRKRLASSTNADSKTYSTSYTSYDQATSTRTSTFTGPNDADWVYATDTTKGNLLSEQDPNGNITSYAYYSNGNRQSITYPDGSSVTFNSYDAKDNVTSVTGTDNSTTTYTYDSYGQINTITDARNNTTTFNHNSTGNLTSIVPPVGASTTFVPDSTGRLTSMTTPGGETFTFTYGAFGNVSTVTSTLTGTTRYRHDANGNVTASTGPAGGVTLYEYDGLNRVKKITDPDGNITNLAYTVDTVTVTDARGGVTVYEYNDQDKLSRVTDQMGYATSIAYTYAGCSSCSSGNGQLPASVTDQEGGVVGYEYDVLGDLVTLTDKKGNKTRFTYDEMRRPKTKKYADDSQLTYDYDAPGRLKSRTNARGTVTTYHYDAFSNLSSISYSDSTPGVTFGRDRYNRVTSIADAAGTTAITYDSATSQVHTVDGPWTGDTLTYTYDALGRLDTLALPGSDTVDYDFDTQGRLTDVKPGSRTFHYAYTGSRPAPDSLNMPNGCFTNYSTDELHRLVSITNRKAGEAISSNSFVYNAAGMRTRETVTAPDNQAPGAALATYSHNSLNQMTSASDAGTLMYDADGNLTDWGNAAGEQFHADYDAENRMTYISCKDGSTQQILHEATFTYGYDGFLAKQVVDSVETRFVRAGGLCLQERDSSNNVTRSYAWDGVSPGGIGGLLEMTEGTSHYDYLYDGKGNVRAVVDASQNVVASYAYDEFGKLVSQSGTLDQPYRFSTKRYYAGIGLNYYGYRFYSASLGRWMTRDPLGEEGGLNLYAAMGNSVANYYDSYGLILGEYIKSYLEDRIERQLQNGNNFAAFIDTMGVTYFGSDLDLALTFFPMGKIKYVGPLFKDVAEVHHFLPKQFEWFFEKAGLNIEEFRGAILKELHNCKGKGVHNGPFEQSWNGKWDEWIKAHKGKNVSADEIFQYLEQLKKEFGFYE